MQNDVGLILRALEFAAGRHRTQKRKGEDQSPYINHPIQVANLLATKPEKKTLSYLQQQFYMMWSKIPLTLLGKSRS